MLHLSHDIPSCHMTFLPSHDLHFLSHDLHFLSHNLHFLSHDIHVLSHDSHIRSTSCFSSPDKAMMSTWTSLSQAQVFTSQAPTISKIQSSTPWVHPSVLDLTKLLPAWVSLPSLLDPTKPIPRRHTGIHKPSKPSQHTSGPRLNTIRG